MSARGRWVPKGAVVMAALAVLSLGVTVFVAQRALTDATDVVVRGEGDVLMHAVVSEMIEEGSVPSAAVLERELASHASAGLRYIALVDREGHPSLAAGTAEMPEKPMRPGESSRLGRRVRMAAPLMPPRHAPGVHRPPSPPPFGMPMLVIELEPPVIAQLRADLTRISIVGAVAGIVLLAFATAWSRNASRLAEIERKAAREQRLVALGSMSSVMAHELRNPLASLKGHAQLLVEDLDDPKKKAKAERVVHEAERLEVLTTSLLDFVRDGPLERASVKPGDLVARSLEHLASSRVDVDVADAPETILADEARLSRALHNVVENALQASPDESKVDLRVARSGSGIAIVVRDRGPGIAAGSEAQIFEPFVTTRTKGTGLGLAVARRIAEQHGGTLTGENHPDGGAVFTLRLPS